ncbi:hypothetical protein SAMN02745126_05704 [Enhydrobacter aerosaccus]|uniref:Phosphate transport regulator n=1 Tax=Enhydrobacter aerosaccus TaxID=225324 RepID=A0A1T4T5E0_9HYPH|nr:hypothetical protein [Enhydrobacter aerosaccus]SKA35662.1 hypothetical protein SAMN02745126_05704 [Enhydrobacter aerosaccus]
MTEKSQIVRLLGEGSLLLPTLLADALAANDRLKLRLTLLQEASAQARHPVHAPPSFTIERQAAGLADPQFDAMVSGARQVSGDRLQIPGAHALVHGVPDDLKTMLAPLEACGTDSYPEFRKRLEKLSASLPVAAHDELTAEEIQSMAAARPGGPETVHRLVMDAHKAINALAAESALEVIDGARVHHVDEADRQRIRAFMAGLNRTAGLAFGHPGLATLATRSGARLVIQNDIGTTDAHVLVIHVEGNTTTVTYTDIHRPRARFFMSMFDGRDVAWNALTERQAQELQGGEAFYLVVGRHAAADEAAQLRFLEFLGSRIVFLIDWNKARKALQIFVGKQNAIDILRWASSHDCGHRGFLELGGADLVFEAIRRTGAGRIPYGARLDAVLGEKECTTFLRHVLRQTSEGLRASRSVRLIRDEIQAELAELFDTAEAALLVLLVRHLGIARTLASAIAESFASDGHAVAGLRTRLAQRAKQMEEKADRLTVQAREMCERMQDADALRLALDEIENCTDALDECAFLWSIAPTGEGLLGNVVLVDLADIVVESISHLVRAAEAASRLPQGNRLDAATSLQAIDAVTLAERRADTAEREALRAFMRQPTSDSRVLVLGIELARTLETATDHLAHAALSLRERVLQELST